MTNFWVLANEDDTEFYSIDLDSSYPFKSSSINGSSIFSLFDNAEKAYHRYGEENGLFIKVISLKKTVPIYDSLEDIDFHNFIKENDIDFSVIEKYVNRKINH